MKMDKTNHNQISFNHLGSYAELISVTQLCFRIYANIGLYENNDSNVVLNMIAILSTPYTYYSDKLLLITLAFPIKDLAKIIPLLEKMYDMYRSILEHKCLHCVMVND